jgi:hypothetical protein
MKQNDKKINDNYESMLHFPAAISPLTGNHIAITHKCMFSIYELVPSLFSTVPLVNDQVLYDYIDLHTYIYLYIYRYIYEYLYICIYLYIYI